MDYRVLTEAERKYTFSQSQQLSDIVNITLHFFLKDVRSMLPPAVNHSTSVS